MDITLENSPHQGKILLRDMQFYGYHGVNRQERDLGQRFVVDLVLWLDLGRAAESDDLEDTLSYAEVYSQVREIVEGEPSRLLEHLAGRIGRAVLGFEQVERVRVRVTKPSPPLAGLAGGTAAVELDLVREAAK